MFILSSGAQAHDVITTKLTWTREISRIVYKRCAGCHRDGGSAFSLITFEAARPWAKAIREEVLERRMPPWGAVKGAGDFKDDPSLSQPEMDMIVQWVEGGAPEGDPAYLPKPPVFRGDARPRRKPGGIRITNAAPVTLAHEVSALSVYPEEGRSMELIARLPGGGVRHLIWLRDYQPEWKRNFEFREPLTLPRGTRLMILSRETAAAILATSTS